MSNYDQYADQLLNSVFENAKQSAMPSPPVQSAEDQFFSQLIARMSPPAPYNNTNNEWLLLQQLQQQKQLLERQQLLSALSPTLSALPGIQPNSNDAALAGPSSPQLTELHSPPTASISDEKVKKIARVPVQAQSPVQTPVSPVLSKPNEKGNVNPIDALVQATAAAALSHHTAPKLKADKPALEKKKSFLRRTWSRRDFKGRDAIPPQQHHHQRQQQQQHQGIVATAQKNTAKSVKKAVPNQTQPSVTVQNVTRESSFWKPREEKPKGWWKGNRANKTQEYYEEEIEYEEQEIADSQEEDGSELEEEQELPAIAPSSRQTRKVVVKRVIVPKKVPSISKPKRPMAFKTPSPGKPKSKSSKKKKNEAASKGSSNGAASRKPIAAGMPMYVMPQQPMYYPQPMMMPAAPQPYMMGGGGGYYMMPPNGMMGASPMMSQQYEDQDQRPTSFSRKKSVHNPRETANDKCSIM